MIETINKPAIQVKVRKVGLQGKYQCRTRTDLTSSDYYGPAGQCNAIVGHDLQRMIMYLKAKVCRWAKVKSQVRWGILMVEWKEAGPGGWKRVLPGTPLHSVEKSGALGMCSELRNVVSTSCVLQNWRKWNCFEDMEVLHPFIFVQLGFKTAFIYGPSLPNYF